MTIQKEQSLVVKTGYPTDKLGALDHGTLHDGMGCQGSNTDFIDDINCGAKTFVDRYKETVNRFSNSSEFFHDIAREVRHGYLCATRNKTYCTPEEKDEGKGPIVTFFVKNRVTEVQYRYTPWVQAYRDGGGVHLFYSVWNDDRFANFSWSGSGSP